MQENNHRDNGFVSGWLDWRTLLGSLTTAILIFCILLITISYGLVEGCLLNHDNDGCGNVTLKVNSRCSKLHDYIPFHSNCYIWADSLWVEFLKQPCPRKENGKTEKENRILCLVHIKSKVRKFHAVVAAATAVKCTKKRENTAVAVLLD